MLTLTEMNYGPLARLKKRMGNLKMTVFRLVEDCSLKCMIRCRFQTISGPRCDNLKMAFGNKEKAVPHLFLLIGRKWGK